jgi:hypothetical protein
MFRRRTEEPFEVEILKRQYREADKRAERLQASIERAERVNALLDMTPKRGSE